MEFHLKCSRLLSGFFYIVNDNLSYQEYGHFGRKLELDNLLEFHFGLDFKKQTRVFNEVGLTSKTLLLDRERAIQGLWY